MSFKHGPSNLPELNIISSFNPLAFLSTRLKDSSTRLSKQDQLQLFEHTSNTELNSLINSSSLTNLERECVANHHRLKCISHVNMMHLVQLELVPEKNNCASSFSFILRRLSALEHDIFLRGVSVSSSCTNLISVDSLAVVIATK